jgi:hypothetical protein
MQITSIGHVSNEHTTWKSSLDFYKDELGVYKNRLTEIAGKNTGIEPMQMAEHFQNQFLLHIEAIDTLKHDINGHLNDMATEVRAHAGHISQAQLATHKSLKERFEIEEKLFIALKQEFMTFCVK